jgi:tRNA threonylcarbamoyladenosine biosynthesis protein TsaB
MFVLAIDTALSACSVAVVRDEQTLATCVEPMARGQAERLSPLVREVMTQAGVSFDMLDRIAVTRGPGAFTGLRVGLAFGRGLALALDIPCIGLSTLEVLAAGASAPRIVAAISVAGSLFVGAWDGRTEILAPCKIEVEALLAHLNGPWQVTGSGADQILTAQLNWTKIHKELPDPVVLAHLARHADPFTHAPKPLYLRGVDAKLQSGLSLADRSA